MDIYRTSPLLVTLGDRQWIAVGAYRTPDGALLVGPYWDAAEVTPGICTHLCGTQPDSEAGPPWHIGGAMIVPLPETHALWGDWGEWLAHMASKSDRELQELGAYFRAGVIRLGAEYHD